jgi:deoxyribonuclease V
MELPTLHDWNVTTTQAVELQNQLASRVVFDQPIPYQQVKLVAGVDVSVRPNENGLSISQAAVAVVQLSTFKVVETVLATAPTSFPYIPGLLSFREGPVIIEALRKLRTVPDVFLFDGMGRAHPRRFGIACHMGLWLQKPTIGCGKSWLLGAYTEPGEARGSHSTIVDQGEVIGMALRTRSETKTMFISVGHLADLSSTMNLVMRCVSKFRLPEPIRAAHRAAGKFEY